MLKCFTIFAMLMLASVTATAQIHVVTVGDRVLLDSFPSPSNPNGCVWCGSPMGGLTVRRSDNGPNAAFFDYGGTSGSYTYVFFQPSVPGKFFDTSIITATYGCYCSKAQFTFSTSGTHIDSAIAIPDSHIRIRPSQIIVGLIYDSVYQLWSGSSNFRLQNDSNVDANVDSFLFQFDSVAAKGLRITLTDSGAPITSKVIPSGTTDSVHLSVVYNPSSYDNVSGIMRTAITAGQLDSTYSNSIYLAFDIPPFYDHTVIPTDTISLSAQSTSAAKAYLTIKCDERMRWLTVSKPFFPFQVKIVDSTKDSIRLEVDLSPVTGGLYRDKFYISYNVNNFRDNYPLGTWIYLIADVDVSGEPIAWQAMPSKNNIRPSGMLYSGNSIYAYGPGVYRLQRNGTDWEPLLDSSYAITRLIKSNAGHLLAVGKQWQLSIDDGLSWKKISLDTFGILEIESTAYSQALTTAGPAYGPDGRLYQAGSATISYTDYYNHNLHTYSRARIAWADDTGQVWHNILDSLGQGANPYQKMIADSAHIYLTPDDARGDPMFRPLLSGGNISFYPDSGYFASDYGGGVSSSRGAVGLPLTSIQATAIAPEGWLYAASNDGLFASTDIGKTWHGKNAGLTTRNIQNIIIDPFGYTYLLTDSGWFRSTASDEAVAEAARAAPTLTLFPNPATGHTELICSSPIEAVSIRDCTGREVKSITAEPNSISCDLDIHALTAGVYFVIVRTATGMKMIELSAF